MKALEGCVKPFKAIARLVGQSVENTPRTIDDGCNLKLLTPPFSGAYVSFDSSAVSLDSFRRAADPSA